MTEIQEGDKKKLKVLICFELVCLAWFITSSEKKQHKTSAWHCPRPRITTADHVTPQLRQCRLQKEKRPASAALMVHTGFFFFFPHGSPPTLFAIWKSYSWLPACTQGEITIWPIKCVRLTVTFSGVTTFWGIYVFHILWSQWCVLVLFKVQSARLPSHNNTSTGTFLEVNKYTKSIYSFPDTSLVSQRGSDWELRDWESCWNVARLIPWKQPRPPQRFFLFASHPLLFPPRSHFSLPSRLRV